MKTQEKMINKKIPEDAYNPKGSMDLDNCYGQTVSELGLQQSKRDQIIAFYLTILGFVIPNVIGMEVADLGKTIAFFAMYGIGAIFCMLFCATEFTKRFIGLPAGLLHNYAIYMKPAEAKKLFIPCFLIALRITEVLLL